MLFKKTAVRIVMAAAATTVTTAAFAETSLVSGEGADQPYTQPVVTAAIEERALPPLDHAKAEAIKTETITLDVAKPDTTLVTKYSMRLRDMEAEANAQRPDNRIILLDYDQMMLSLARESDIMRYMVINQLNNRGIELPAPLDMVWFGRDNPGKPPLISTDDLFLLTSGMGGKEHFDPSNMDARSVRIESLNPAACVVIPGTLDKSSLTMSEYLISLDTGFKVVEQIAPRAQFERATYHEMWHCYDSRFVREISSQKVNANQEPRKYAFLAHRAEMFAEVAAHLTMIRNGHTELVRQHGDARALMSEYDADYYVKTYNPKTDPQYYVRALYYLTPGIDAVADHLRQVGLEKIKSYTWRDIERLAVDITEKHVLTESRFDALMSYYVNRKGTMQRLASSDSARDKDSLAFLKQHQARAELAKSRLVKQGPKPPPAPYVEEVEDDAGFLNKLPADVHDAMVKEIDDRLAALPAGANPVRVLVDMLDDYRDRLHATQDRDKISEYEQKLLFMRAYVSIGAFKQKVVVHETSRASKMAAPVVEQAVTPPATVKPPPPPSL